MWASMSVGHRSELDQRGSDGRPAQVGPQSGGELREARLGRRVRGEPGKWCDAGQGRHVHDVASASFEHGLQRLPAELNGGDQVQPVDRLEVGGGLISHVAGEVDARVVDQDIDRADLRLDAGDQAVHGGRISEVGRMGGSTEIVSQVGQRVPLRATSATEAPASANRRARASPIPAGRSGDQDGPVP